MTTAAKQFAVIEDTSISVERSDIGTRVDLTNTANTTRTAAIRALGIAPGTQRITGAECVFLIRLSRRFTFLLSPPSLNFSLDQTVPNLGLSLPFPLSLPAFPSNSHLHTYINTYDYNTLAD